MHIIYIGCVLLSLTYLEVASQPVLGGGTQCFSIDCPVGTVACKRVMRSEGNIIKTRIECLDEGNHILRKFQSSKDNPFGNNFHFDSISFSGTHVHTIGNPQTVNVHVDNNIRNEFEEI